MPMTLPRKCYYDTQKYIAGTVMWPKFDNSSISMKEVIIN